MRNLYQVLGTTAEADDSQLKSAFRNLAKALHPDLNGGDRRAEERFRELYQAYEVLRDPEARAAYDAFLADKQTGVRRRFRNAASTMVAVSVLSAAACLLLTLWLHGEAPYLVAKQEAGGQSESVAVAFAHRPSEADGPSAQKTAAEDANPSASPPPEPRVTQMRGDEILQPGSMEAGVDGATRDRAVSEREGDPTVSTAPLAVEPRRKLLRDETKHAAILDRPGKPSSDKARKTGLAKVPVAERAERREGDEIATAPTLPVAAVGSGKLRGWLTADEPFVGPGGIDR